MGTFSKVFAIGFAMIAALVWCGLICTAVSELFRRKPLEDARRQDR
jgi:hypothetical protein